MSKRKKRPKKERQGGLQGIFFRGLVTVLPVALTVVVFGLIVQGLNQYVVGPINRAIYWSLEHNRLGWEGLEWIGIDPTQRKYLDESRLPVDLRDLVRASPAGTNDPSFREGLELHRAEHLGLVYDFDDLAIDPVRLRDDVKAAVHPLVGVAVSILLVVWLGWLVGGFLGRKFMQSVDRALHMIPIVKSVYPYSKQLVDFFFADSELEFDTVVAVPYPSPGIWSIAFVTSSSMRTLLEVTGETMITCFVPSSPMPMTGYTIFLSAENVIPLDLSVDEAFRVTMTGGVLIPPRERLGGPDEIAAFFEARAREMASGVEPVQGGPEIQTPDREAMGE